MSFSRSRNKVAAAQKAATQRTLAEHFQKLEDRLLKDFQEMGQKAIEESTAAISDQLNERIETLEEISALQSETITHLRDTSIMADRKVTSMLGRLKFTRSE